MTWLGYSSKSKSGGFRNDTVQAPTKGTSSNKGLKWTRKQDEARETCVMDAFAGGSFETAKS